MKVVLINSLVYPDELGGVESYLFKVAPALAEHAEVVIVTGPRSRTGSFPGEAGNDHQGNGPRIRIIELHNLNMYPLWDFRAHSLPARLLWHGIDSCNPRTLDLLKDVIRNEKPDVIHTHNVRGISLMSLRAAAASGLPHVHTLHDYLLLSPLVTLRIGDKPIPPSLPTNKLYQLYTRKLVEGVNSVIAPSKSALDSHKNCGFFRKASKFILPNPSPDIVHRPAGPPHSHQAFVGEVGPSFLFVGSLERSKGVNLLLEAIKAVRESNVRIHIVGRGSLERLVVEHAKLDPRIIFHGYLPRETLARLYKSCDVLLFVSQWPEILPTVISEAFSHEMPVVATAVGGVVEMVSSDNGWLIAPGSVKELTEKIETIAKTPSLLEQKRSKLPMSLTFSSIQEHVQKLLSIYGQTVEQVRN